MTNWASYIFSMIIELDYSIRHKYKFTSKRKSSKKLVHRKPPNINLDNPVQCRQCDKTITSQKHFEIHTYLHKLLSRKLFEEGKCSFCEAHLSADKLQEHLESHEETCNICQAVFANPFVLGVHMSDHDEEHRLCCPFCTYKGSLSHCLKAHLLTKHLQLKIFRCEECGSTYTAKRHLQEHIRFHHKKMDPYSCIVCRRVFIFKSSLDKHQINSHRPLIDGDVPSNYCIICKRVLSTVEALQRHIQEKHSGNKPVKLTDRFVCDICGKDFSHRQSWLLHTKGHSGLKPYSCKMCSKSFRVRAFLTQHERSHSNDRPFSCEKCGNRFKRKEALRRHLATHTDVKPFVCPNCDKTFRRREHLKLHLNSCNRNMEAIRGAMGE